MPVVDAHQHFWYYDPVKHEWINEAMSVIRKDFLPADLKPILQQNAVDVCVAVQADQTEAETVFLVELASQNAFIKGVVGWVDLRAENIRERLLHYKQYPVVKGFRHILQEEEPAFMLQPDFLRGIAALKEFGYTYDILIYPKHLDAAIEFVEQFPDQPFVIDHMAKPLIKEGLLDKWKQGMQALAQFPNVYCKLSGMVTEADWHQWKLSDFAIYLNIVTEAFGTGRLLYGSDWPVCLVAASYDQMINIVRNYFSSFTADEQEAVFGGNAKKFYQL